MAYKYVSQTGETLTITRCGAHIDLLVTDCRDFMVSIPVSDEDVAEVLRGTAAEAGLRYLAQEI